MKTSRLASKRRLPGSPFNTLAPARPAETFAVRDQVTHDKYGLGVILGVEDDAVLVDFSPIDGESRSHAPSSPSCSTPQPGVRTATGPEDAAWLSAAVRRGGTAGPPGSAAGCSVHYRPCLKIAPIGAGWFRGITPLLRLAAQVGRAARLSRLERLDLLGLRALGPPAGRVLNPLVLLKAAVTVSLDGGVVNEDVVCAVIRGDETVALIGVEPLHGALSHVSSPGGTIVGTCLRTTRVGATACLRRPG
jgi:hypothetical protein